MVWEIPIQDAIFCLVQQGQEQQSWSKSEEGARHSLMIKWLECFFFWFYIICRNHRVQVK